MDDESIISYVKTWDIFASYDNEIISSPAVTPGPRRHAGARSRGCVLVGAADDDDAEDRINIVLLRRGGISFALSPNKDNRLQRLVHSSDEEEEDNDDRFGPSFFEEEEENSSKDCLSLIDDTRSFSTENLATPTQQPIELIDDTRSFSTENLATPTQTINNTIEDAQASLAFGQQQQFSSTARGD